MNCDKYLHLISGHLDGCNSEAEEKQLQEHLQICDNCRSLLSQMQKNEQLLSGSETEPPADLTARIMEAVRKEPKKRSRKRFYSSIAAAGLATAALLALVFFGSSSLPGLSSMNDAAEMEMEPYAMEDYLAVPENMGALIEYSERSTTSTYYGSDDALTGEGEPAKENATEAPHSDQALEYSDHNTSPSQEAPDATVSETVQADETILYSAGLSPVTDTYGTRPSSIPAAGLSSIYGISAADGTLQELPTLIIYGAEAADFPTLSQADPLPNSMLSLKTANIASDGSLYQRFFSLLPLELGMPLSLPNEPQFLLSRYRVSYDCFTALLDAAAGSFETAVYFPKDLGSGEDCLVILISTEE